MSNRAHAFGEEEYSVLDNFIFFLRKRQVVNNLPTLHNQRIADLGSGYDARLLRQLLTDANGVTATAVDIAFAPEVVSDDRIACVHNDLNAPITIDENTHDVIVSLAVIEHLTEPQNFLNEAYRILKPGGKLLLTTPGPTSQPLLEFLAYRLKVISEAEIRDHKNYFSSKQLKAMFVKAGFNEQNVTPRTFIFGMNNLVLATK